MDPLSIIFLVVCVIYSVYRFIIFVLNKMIGGVIVEKEKEEGRLKKRHAEYPASFIVDPPVL